MPHLRTGNGLPIMLLVAYDAIRCLTLNVSCSFSLLAESAERQYLPGRAEVPSGVIAVRGSGARVMFSGGTDREDIRGPLHWYKPKKPRESEGKIVVMRREAAGEEYQDLINMRRGLMSHRALAMVVVQAAGDPPIVELPTGDASEPIAIPVLYVQAKTLERDAKDGVEAMIMFDAVAGAQEFVTQALTAYTPGIIKIDSEDVKMALNEHEVPYLLPEMHRKIANSLNRSLKQKISELNGALASLQQAMSNAQDNFAVSLETVDQRLKVSDGRVLFLEHIIQDMQDRRITHLQQEVRKEQEHSKTLEEQLYKPEVQALLHAKQRKARQSSVAEMFDSSRLRQPGQESLPMPLGKAAEILGKTKPGDLAEQADFLVGQAAEMAGSEDADVMRVQGKLRMKENAKWFNQWFNILNWRTMSKVIKEGTLPLQSPNTKTFRHGGTLNDLRSPAAGASAVGLPAITPRGQSAGDKGQRSQLSTPRSARESAAASTPDSTMILQTQLEESSRMTENLTRSFVAEVKELEKECTHWRNIVDKKHCELRSAQQELANERLAHSRSKAHASQREAAMQGQLLAIVGEMQEARNDLVVECASMSQLQAEAIVADANVSRRGVRTPRAHTEGRVSRGGARTPRAHTTAVGASQSQEQDPTRPNTAEVLVVGDEEATAGRHGQSPKVAVKKADDAQPTPSGVLGILFKKWSGAGQSGGKKAKSVDFKEFTEMLKALKLMPAKLSRHKAQEIFRQANRRPGDPTPDGDTSEMDWDEFEFAMNKVCQFCKVEVDALVEGGGTV